MWRLRQLHQLLRRVRDRLRPEEMNGGGVADTYLYRWALLQTRWGNVYLHRFVGNDWAPDQHDHPKRFISIGLCGSYIEESEDCVRVFVAPWLRSFPATHRHRLLVPNECWTLVLVGRSTREWGFWTGEGEAKAEKWMRWDEYVAKAQGAD